MAWVGYRAGMAEETLLRIGKGVPRPPRQPRQPPKPSHWLIAAAVIFSVAIMVAAVYFLDPPKTSPTAIATSAVDNRLECTSINRQFEIWSHGRTRLEDLRTSTLSDVYLKMLQDDGDDFLKAAKGYSGVPVSELALAIAEYNFKLSVIGLELDGRDATASEPSHTAALNAWSIVEGKYYAFKAAEC